MKNRLKIKIFTVIGFIFLLALLMLFLFSGENYNVIKAITSGDLSQEELKEALGSLGWRGYITFGILAMLQVVLTFLPSEPVEVLAGIAFGFQNGLLCYIIGVALGNTLIYILYKTLGDKLNAYFDKSLKVDLDKAGESGKVTLLVFILYFLPAIPYGVICLFAATVRMKYPRYIIVTVLGSIPSICIGVGLGHVAISSSWKISVAVFVVLVVLLIIMFIKKDALFALVNSYIDKKAIPENAVRPYHRIKLDFAYAISRIILFFKGVKVKYTKKVKDIDTPSVVLCNHGSFFDFVYAGSLIRHKSPHFIVARLYFYKSIAARVLRAIGCFPKSMFASDLESAKNCLRVLKNGGVLAMMPEARLSTAGEFEDIQPGTYSFIKNSKVNVYYIKINGGYLAKPKWAPKMRRGAFVEASLDLLFTKEELSTLSLEEIKGRVDKALYFNDFKWLEEHGEIKYGGKLAQGLENILTRCPSCNGKHTLVTKGMEIRCESCGLSAKMDKRYGFVDAVPFDNLNSWYKWQVCQMEKEMENDPDFKLESAVVLKNPSKDGKSSLYEAGKGICTLNSDGLTYVGTKDGEDVTITFPMAEIYRLLFGAGENFEIYRGREIYYFMPENKKTCVDWYIASRLFKEQEERGKPTLMLQ
ncbi:MAG: hypothetical protein E7596_07995 [Ruminococcaceae bacterium]|nr:hypothetical protein [Oscillospiraceae bacterium]